MNLHSCATPRGRRPFIGCGARRHLVCASQTADHERTAIFSRSGAAQKNAVTSEEYRGVQVSNGRQRRHREVRHRGWARQPTAPLDKHTVAASNCARLQRQQPQQAWSTGKQRQAPGGTERCVIVDGHDNRRRRWKTHCCCQQLRPPAAPAAQQAYQIHSPSYVLLCATVPTITRFGSAT